METKGGTPPNQELPDLKKDTHGGHDTPVVHGPRASTSATKDERAEVKRAKGVPLLHART